MSVAHEARHAATLAHFTPPGHAPAVPALHVPVPLHVPAGVSWPFEHETEPHEVLAGACSQTPPAAHLPSFPHGGAAVHWPAGAGEPAS